MIEILVSNVFVAIVDDVDEDLVNSKWRFQNKGADHAIYAVRHNGDVSSELMHRVVFRRMVGRDLGRHEFIDHINMNGLDNRRANLRLASSAQNHQNTNKRKRFNKRHPSSKYKGVCWDKSREKWQAHIVIDKKSIFLGRFESEVDAAKAYNKHAKNRFGEFARLNDAR